MTVRVLATVALTLLLPGRSLGAQTPDQRRLPLEGLQLTTARDAAGNVRFWSTEEAGSGGHTIFVQNTSSAHPVVITSWEVYDCRNVRGTVCRVHDKKLRLKPKETIRLVTVMRDVYDREFSYQYRFTSEWADSTADAP